MPVARSNFYCGKGATAATVDECIRWFRLSDCLYLDRWKSSDMVGRILPGHPEYILKHLSSCEPSPLLKSWLQKVNWGLKQGKGL